MMKDLKEKLRAVRFEMIIGGLFLLCGIGSALARTPGPDDFAHFAYDRSAPLNMKQISVQVRNGVTIADITYTGSDSDTVPAYLVIPKGSAKFAGIIWGHWLMPGAANSDRNEFLDEAIALASHGAVSLLIAAPQKRPGFKPIPGSGPDLVAQQVIDLRRGMDLLLSRPDISPDRVAYVGHSYDAAIGAILDAADKRFAAFVFMAGPQAMDKMKPWADPATYAAKLGPAPALFQYGLHDEEWAPLADTKAYAAIASEPKTVKFYDAAHALNAEAQKDRDSYLSQKLKLRR